MTNSNHIAAEQTYNVSEWGAGYFSINEGGQVVAHPKGKRQGQSIVLSELVAELKEQGIKLPVLVRFTDILQDRIKNLVEAFAHAKKQRNYGGKYTAVYPIKVNQQHSVIDKLLNADQKVGLEAGSKAELLAILGTANRNIRIICNGYKDQEFLRLAQIAAAMGHKVCVVIEKLSELSMFLDSVYQIDGPQVELGIRIKLHSAAKGQWQNTGGEKGKFGFNASQLLTAIESLKQADAIHLLTLVHFHIGSQVANIRDIHNAMLECARHYAELRQLGININTVDVGGGLGVDYEGSHSRSACSINYSVEEYAKNVVFALADACQQLDLPEPDIISESGRAMTAHHALLITNVIECESAPGGNEFTDEQVSAFDNTYFQALWQDSVGLTSRNALEAYHDAMHYFSDAHQAYKSGQLSLLAWAQVEQLYFSLLRQIKSVLVPSMRAHRDILDELNEKLADKLFCNFSLFQSLPDAWGIDQLFPVLPVDQLDKTLDHRAIINDITCDSDGQIKQYVDGVGIESSLPIPKFDPEQPYDIAIFMLGAYQEILGDLHNLFGDTDSVHVELSDQGHVISQKIQGESAEDVLKTVHFSKHQLLANCQKQMHQQQSLATNDINAMLNELAAGVDGYTYFEYE